MRALPTYALHTHQISSRLSAAKSKELSYMHFFRSGGDSGGVWKLCNDHDKPHLTR